VKIEVGRITEEGILGQEDIDAPLWELDTEDVAFLGSIHLDAVFRRVKSEILVKVEVSALQRVRCSRCLEFSGREEHSSYYFSYEARKLGRFLEIDNDVREQILLSWPMKVLCRPDCKGLCPECGENLNTGACKCGESIALKKCRQRGENPKY